MRKFLLVCLLPGLSALHFVRAAEDAQTTGTVLVQIQVPQCGEIADTLVAYGSAVPALNAGMALSVPTEGRVMRIAVTPGEAVRAGQALLDFHLSAAATSAHEQAASALKLARGEQTRIARLLAEQLATRDQQAQADKAAADAQAALDALERETGGQSQQTLTAPFDGIVNAVAATQGERVVAGAPLITLTRSLGMVVTVGIEPAQRDRVHPGQSVQVESLDGGTVAHSGKVVRIDHALNPKTRLVDADVAVEDELLQGEAFRAKIEVGQSRGWLVPRDAVLDDDGGAYVFQVANGNAVRVSVKRIGSNEETAVIDGPLDPQRAVVVRGNYQLDDGMAVRVQAAPASGIPGKEP
ncbi:MAG: efflux RND transporter periplasmic adaptor subunit [Rudaea sp.]|nr:efflux RND transporter periplasmic adaptor subunit [Rudaea sp.]